MLVLLVVYVVVVVVVGVVGGGAGGCLPTRISTRTRIEYMFYLKNMGWCFRAPDFVRGSRRVARRRFHISGIVGGGVRGQTWPMRLRKVVYV